MAAQATPETLEFERLLIEGENEQRILNYLNQHAARINLVMVEPEPDRLGFVSMALPNKPKLAIRLLDLGAPVPDMQDLGEAMSDGFSTPLALSRELMLKLIEKGFSKNDMLHILCYGSTGTNANLLPILRDLGGLDFNYVDYGDFTPIGTVIYAYDNEQRGTFLQKLRFLVENGANPNLVVNEEGQTAYEMLERQDIPNKGPIRRILDQFVAAPAVQAPAVQAQPAVPAAQAPAVQQAQPQHDYQKLWWEELAKKDPDLQKIREYAPHVDVNKPKHDTDVIPLTIAIQNKNINLLKTLLDLGANPNAKSELRPVWMYCINSDKIGAPHNLNIQMLEEMRKKGADFTQKFMGDNAYFRIIRNVEAEKKIISYINYFLPYVDVTELSHYGSSILYMMIGIIGDTNIKRALVEKGAPLESRDGTSVLRSLTASDLTSKPLMDAIFAKKRDPNYMALNMLWGYFLNTNIAFSYDLNKLVNIILSYNPDVNKVTDGIITILIQIAQIAQKINGDEATCEKLIQTFKKVIEKGANPNYVNSEGKTAADYITNPNFVKLKEFLESFKPQEAKNTKPWTGFTKADIAFTNEVFHQVTHTQDLAIANPNQVLFSMCPVCLKYIEHASGSCMYMTHSCVEQSGFQGYYHKKLWATYSYEKQLFNPLGNQAGTKRVVEWCTLCGRICKDHKHYQLARLYKEDGKTLKPVPGFAGAGDYFIVDCSKPSVGGGGLKEKVNRYRRFREVVLFLNDQVGDITFEEAINTLVEEVWEAPLAARRLEVNYALKKKVYNAAVANSRFPAPQAEAEAVYANVQYPNASNTSLQPLVFAEGDVEHRNVWDSDNKENIVQFRHRMADGTINEHAGPNQQIALDNLMNYLGHMATEQSSADFGLCWQHSDNYLTIFADEAHPPPKCTARLYPAEVLAAIEGAVYKKPTDKEKDLKVYNAYRVAFNKKFGSVASAAAVGGARRIKRQTQKHRSLLKRTRRTH